LKISGIEQFSRPWDSNKNVGLQPPHDAQVLNAFLLEIKNDDPTFKAIQELIALRFVHVLHEGITPHEAGRRYQALMLDYGFYVGIRAARSVDLFQKEPKAPSVQQLRKLPIFTPTRKDADALGTAS
jgi:hypothetical protein